ncbi:uncharacterized protein LOC106081977 [Stomoxys calcitrans]|uniref:uncharacterized protein LOC106081977 n=1 Tax=Stomoxys calcitrans TaxID=35570 RepID=UPI0027E2B5C7|nr:uncharacterized protein LOC106081977 [Stomoxys calcitrans]XP_059223006.1 uncharacterized protein LOC106081977 [Stomoxys calcitrans]
MQPPTKTTIPPQLNLAQSVQLSATALEAPLPQRQLRSHERQKLQRTNHGNNNNNNNDSCHNDNCQKQQQQPSGHHMGWMLTPGAHKIFKITSLATNSYIQVFVLITMLLTVLSAQQSSAAQAAPTQISWATMNATARQHHNLLKHLYSHHHLHHRLQLHHPAVQASAKSHLPLALKQHPASQLPFLPDANDDSQYAQRHDTRNQLETDIDGEKRFLRKRQLTWHAFYTKTMNSSNIAWQNPCGGQYIKTKRTPKVGRKEARKEIFKNLITYTNNIYKTLRSSDLSAIDIRNMSMWAKKTRRYKFLPQMLKPSNKTLRHCHRDMQHFVAACDYLFRASLHWDYIKEMQESQTSKELNLLCTNAREFQCNLEAAINNTMLHSKAKKTKGLLRLSRKRMEKKLNFYTDVRHTSPLNWHKVKNETTAKEIHPLDLKMFKARFLKYIKQFLQFPPQRKNKDEGSKMHKMRKSQKKTN